MIRNLIIINVLFAMMLWFFSAVANADDKNVKDSYSGAVVGHIIQSKMNGTNVDVQKLFQYEMDKVAHQFALESIQILQKYLPVILDNALSDMRFEADKNYKCNLLDNTKIKDDCK